MQNTSIAIVQILQEAGHTAYWAGGCVRDFILDKEPKDYDIATSALPDEIEALFEKTYPIGKRFGVITVAKNGHHFEVATFRSDGSSSDGRRPDAVLFTHPAEDALRRDFTINGLFYDPLSKDLHDFVGGRNDLQNGILRFIGEPAARIKEDHLRILRAVRFKNTLGFQYHEQSWEALLDHADLAHQVSFERIRDELNKMLLSGQGAMALQDLQKLGILSTILPELSTQNLLWPALQTVDQALLPWLVLLQNAQEPETILRRLRFPRRDAEALHWALQEVAQRHAWAKRSLGEQRQALLSPHFALFAAWLETCAPLLGEEMLLQTVQLSAKELHLDFPERPEPWLTGADVMRALNLKPGPEVGKILRLAWHAQLARKLNSREEALEWLESHA